MPAMNPPSSDAVVQVREDSVAAFEAAGWVKVKATARKPGPSKRDSK